MRALLSLLFVVPLSVSAAGMGEAEARHLLLRTGFSPNEGEIRDYAVLTRAAAVDRLLAGTHTEARTPPPAWVNEFVPPSRLRALKNAPEEERKAFLREQIEKSLELRAWWMQEMLATGSPFTERMTLFWHNHFVSSQQKVKSPVLMYRQNLLLRREALGNFGTLLHAVAKDPAMLVYLDSVSNHKGKPNENFAREVMELFTLGPGHYGEQDIREAARAFTGWGVDRKTFAFRLYRARHDDGEKTVLGRRGDFDGDDVLDILLAQPATAELVVTKLWREFVSPTPEPTEVRRLAAVFRASHYEIKPLLHALFISDTFYAPANRNVLVKSPVELVVGSLRLLDVHPGDLRPAAFASRNLGQDLFAPPNVKGWPGGDAWINSSTLLGRRQLVTRLFRAGEMPAEAAQERPLRMNDMKDKPFLSMMLAMQREYRFDAARWFAQFNGPEAARRAEMERLVLGGAPYEPPPAGGDERTFLSALMLDPVYQLK